MENRIRSHVRVPLDSILGTIAAAEDYGYYDSDLLATFAEWTEWVSDEELRAYAEWYLSDEAQEWGYEQEDYDIVLERITEWRDRYTSRYREEANDNED